MTNTLTRLLLTAALCGLFLLSEAQERNAVSAPEAFKWVLTVVFPEGFKK